MTSHHTPDAGFEPTEYAQLIGQILEDALATQPTVVLPLTKAQGKILAHDVIAAADSPAFANSQMDGYALTALASNRPQRTFTVGEDIPAGSDLNSTVVDDNLVYPIMTGAPIPQGYDCVIPEEAATPQGQTQGKFAAPGSRVELPSAAPGQFVRYPGEDIQAGELLIEAGTALTPVHLGVLAGQGLGQVTVYADLRILVLTGGDEVTDGTELAPGQIYDANGPMLAALLEREGAVVERLQISDDVEDLCTRVIDRLEREAPTMIVSCGGISHGKYEVIRLALQRISEGNLPRLGIETGWFGHVRQQPGGPQGYALLNFRNNSVEQQIPWLAFPGNPVSTLVSYTLILRPYLQKRAGKAHSPRYGILRADNTFEALENKTQYRRGTATVVENHNGSHSTVLETDPNTGSHLLHRASRSNALIEIPPRSHNSNGTVLRWYPL